MAQLLCFMNAYSEGMSGGDLRFIESIKRMPEFRPVVITSVLGEIACRERRLSADFVVTSNEKKFKNILLTYTIRTLAATLKTHANAGTILYSTSDFLPDVLPAFVNRRQHNSSRWVQFIFHQIPSRRRIPYFGQRTSFSLIKRWADLVIVDNALLREALIQQGFRDERVEVNPPGIAVDYFRSIQSRRGYDAVFIGRLHSSKGVFDLIEIWRYVHSKEPTARLAIIGTGPDQIRRKLEQRIEEWKLGELVHLLGYVDSAQAYGILKGSRLFLSASREEGFGISLLEAMACGLPCVAWDLPVYRQAFPGGMALVPPGDWAGFAETCWRLWSDAAECRRLVQRGQEIACQYDWERVVARDRELLGRLVPSVGETT